MSVWQLKVLAERRFGIPTEQIRLSYLEEADLMDNKRLFDCAMAPGAMIRVHLWPQFERLYHAVHLNKMDALFQCIRSQEPHNDPFLWAGLFLASFFGHKGTLFC